MIKYKVFLGVFGLSLFFLSITGLTINETYAKTLRRNEENYNILASDKVKSQFDFTVDLISRTASSLSINSEVKDFLSDSGVPSTLASPPDSNSPKKLINTIMSLQPFINSIQIVGADGRVCSTSETLNSKQALVDAQQYFEQIRKAYPRQVIWSSMHKVESAPNVLSEVISCIFPVSDAATAELDGIIIINWGYDFIREEFVNFAIESNEKAFIVNNQGEIILNQPRTTSFEPVLKTHPELLEASDLMLDTKVFGVESIIVSKSLKLIDWKIVRIIPTITITAQTNQMDFYLRILLTISMVTSLLYAIWLAATITRPIHTLTDACKHIEQGDLSYHVNVRGKDEFGKLASTFNMMVSQLNLSFQNELDSQKQKAEMQFKVLQAQINPHFLYNTLDSIKWLAVMQNMNNIAEMSTALINLLKYNLTSSDAVTTLREEIESVRNYITIQKYRYLDTFEFTTDLDENSLDCKVLRFILQPLVENCILHGFGNVEQNYKIIVTTFFIDDELHIKVIDNGSGMDMKAVNQLNSSAENNQRFSNIAVKNIQQRIELYFGKKYGLTYQSVPGEGTIAEITQPGSITN